MHYLLKPFHKLCGHKYWNRAKLTALFSLLQINSFEKTKTKNVLN